MVGRKYENGREESEELVSWNKEEKERCCCSRGSDISLIRKMSTSKRLIRRWIHSNQTDTKPSGEKGQIQSFAFTQDAAHGEEWLTLSAGRETHLYSLLTDTPDRTVQPTSYLVLKAYHHGTRLLLIPPSSSLPSVSGNSWKNQQGLEGYLC